MQTRTDFSTMHHRVLHHARWVALTTILVVLVAFTIGCGKSHPKLAPVSGSVTYCGKPLSFGAVTFQSDSGPSATGIIQPDGTFQMATTGEGNGVVAGKHKISISCFEQQNPNALKGKTGVQNEAGLGKPLIPQKYLTANTSGICIDVRPDDNKPVVLQLTDK